MAPPSSGIGAGCAADKDCPTTLICYNTTWTNHEAMCLCSTWFGFSGTDCDQVLQTSTSQWRVATAILFILGWFLVSVRGIYDMYRLVMYKSKWSVTHTCQTQLIFATLLSLVSEILGIISTFSPHDLVYYLPGTDRKTTPLFYPKQILTTLSYCFIFLTLATLPLHWREIANQVFRPNKAKLSYMKPLIVFELTFSIVCLIFVALSMPSFAYISAIPFVVIVVALYGIGGLSLWRILTRAATTNPAEEQKQRFLKSAKNVASTSLKMFFIGGAVIILNLIFALTSGDSEWRQLSPPNSISTPVVISGFSSLALLGAAFFGQRYLTSTIRATLTRSSTRDNNTSGGVGAKGDRVMPINQQQQQMYAQRQQQQGSDYDYDGQSSAQPDSIVQMDNPKAIKLKRKILRRKGGPRRLRPITDYTDVTSTNPLGTIVASSGEDDGGIAEESGSGVFSATASKTKMSGGGSSFSKNHSTTE